MLSQMEFEARSIEKALKKASETFNIPKEALKYDIISYGSTGIFGLVGTKKARIRVCEPDHKTSKVNDNKNRHIEPIADISEDSAEPESTSPDQYMETKNLKEEADVLQLGREVLQTILDAITSGARIVQTRDGDTLIFNVKGGNAAVLIGKRGQTLDAIQYLVEKIVNKRSEKRLRLQVDVEGYLESRKENLRQQALRLAQKAKTYRKPMTMGQLKPQERRVVHLILKDNQEVRTQSIGDGFVRKLLIIPKRKAKQNDGAA